MFSFDSKPLSLVLYVVVFATSAYCLTTAANSRTKDQKKTFMWSAILIPSILSGFRLCGTDLGTNCAVYRRAVASPFMDVFTVERPLYFVAMKVASFLGGVQWFLFFLALIPCACVCKALYDSREKIDLSLAYTTFLFGFFIFSWNFTRQYAAVGIICYAVRYVFSRDLWKFLACVYLAYLFHPSCLVALAVYPLWTKNQSLPTGWKLFLYYSLAILFVVNIGSFLGRLPEALEEYDEYLLGDDRGRNRDFWVNLIWLALFLCYREKLRKFDPKNDYYIALFGLVCVIGFTGFFSPFIKRVAFYFSVFQCFLIGSLPLASQSFDEKKKEIDHFGEGKTFQKSLSSSTLSSSIPKTKKSLRVRRGVWEISKVRSVTSFRRLVLHMATGGSVSRKTYFRINDTTSLEGTSSERRVVRIDSIRSPEAKRMRLALFLAVFGIFFLVAYVLGQAEVIPYRHAGWETMTK